MDTAAEQRVANFLCDRALRDAEAGVRPHRQSLDQAVPGFWGRLLSNGTLSALLRAGHERTVAACEAAASTLRSAPTFAGNFAPLADALDKAAVLLDGLNQKLTTAIEPQRLPLKSDVLRTTAELRKFLDQMDGRLRSHFPQDFIDSLYPELDNGRPAKAPAEA